MHNLLFNVGLALLLLSIVGCILWCMYKGKPDPIQKKERLEKERMYVNGKIQSIQLDKQHARNMLITGLPPEFT
jgi:hypothetical protein